MGGCLLKSKTYRIVVRQCNESGIYIIDESNFPGLHLEAASVAEMGQAIQQIVPELMGNLKLDECVEEVHVEVFVEQENQSKPQVQSVHKRYPRTRVLVEQQMLGVPV